LLVVDSVSTDSTLSIAALHPLSIVQLRPEWKRTPAAGRYIGYQKTHGEFILFLDGDSELSRNFAASAIEQLRRDRSVAGVVGRQNDVYYDKYGVKIGQRDNVRNLPSHVTKVPRITGSVMLRRAALEEVGSYNPFLYSEEELELSDRLREAGYSILGLPEDMILHHTVPKYAISNIKRRLRNSFHLGAGQVVRLRVGREKSPAIRAYIAEGLRWILFLTMTATVAVLSIALRNSIPLGVWFVISLVAFGYMIARSKSVLIPLRYSFFELAYVVGFVRGFLMRPFSPESYPTDAVQLK
jgi:GT2 family glycosyltransferase